MNTLSYKGYIGTIEVSEPDNCLYGKVLDLPKETLISYEGQTIKELREDFEGAIDDYLTFCKEEGIEPHKTYSGSLNVRLSPDVHSKVAILAKQTGISINAFIRKAVENQIASML
ncbi:MAG: type II toxin-antitoxin system HicB family antitoxin [Muribaculaceae bacterium]|nr:type II toxin-antitoxin system HicB family antitoxin [Muribaculaceae bacterium]